MIRLSANFILDEFLESQTATRKGYREQFEPSPEVVANLGALAQRLEVVRAILGSVPILISSGYRCAKLNNDPDVGGDPHSAHLTGFAADFTAPKFGTPLEVCRRLASTKHLEFDRIIFEYGRWCHFAAGPGNGKQLFSKFFGDRDYHPGIIEAPPLVA